MREVDITWRALRSDLNTTLLPIGLFVAAAASVKPGIEPFEWFRLIALSQLYALPYIAWFCFSGQAGSVEEDRVEKPFRPLPRGLLSVRGALVRAGIWSLVYLAISAVLGVLPWAVLWLVAGGYHNLGGGHRHWLTKNTLTMSLGTAAQLGAGWTLVHGNFSPSGLTFTVGMSVWVGIMANIQDFRDVEGDVRSGRRTLPVLLGDRARWAMATAAAVLGLITPAVLSSLHDGTAARLFALTLGAWQVWIGWRLLAFRDRASDDRTYKLHLSLWYCAALAGAALYLEAP
ncbi:MAG: UbiA family prenyltransferase [Myxococcota bacterium]